MALAVPEGGLTLHRDSVSSQFLRLNLPQSTLADLLNVLNDQSSASAAGGPRLRLGKHPSLLINSKSTPFHAYPQTTRSEIYQQGPDGDGDGLYFSGVLSHSLEVQKAKEATAATDEALTNLERSLNAFEKGKESRRTPLLATIDQMRALGAGDNRSATGKEAACLARKSTSKADQEKERVFKNANASRSTPASPALLAHSPLPAAPTTTTITTTTTAQTVDKHSLRLEAIRTPLIHLVAIRPVSAKFLAARTRCNTVDVLALTNKHCTPNRLDGSKFDLKDKAYKDLDVWSFPYPSEDERSGAIQNAISAFDRMRISKSDRLWQMLLPKQDRGKGIVLSRLNLHTQPQPPQTRVQGQEEGYGTGNESEGPMALDQAATAPTSAPALAQTQTAKPAPAKKRALEKALSSKRGPKPKVPPTTLTGKVTKKTEKKSPVPGSAPLKLRDVDRFKSAEFVLDSDEDENNDSNATGRQVPAATAPAASTAQRGRPAKTKKAPVKRQPAATGTASTTITTTTIAATRPPAKVTSPLKPSPLGSSPPTNASDVDSHSRPSHTQSLSHSSSSSSPLIRQLPRKAPPAQQTSKARPTPPSTTTATTTNTIAKPGALKRKARPMDDTRPPINTTATSIGLGIHAPEPKRRRPSSISSTTTSSLSQPESMHSGSGSGSASPPISQTILRDRLRLKSARFKQHYAQYRLLHDKMTRSRSGMMDFDMDVDLDQIQKLERLHSQLQKMKQEIWDEDRRLRMSS